MSEVLIKGIKMPKSCPCELVGVGYDMYCSFAYGVPSRVREYYECCEKETRPDWCPIIEVSQHGDLLSREWLIDIALHLINTAKNDDISNGVKWLLQYIIDASAIIPAELPKEEKEDKELLVEKIRKLQTYKLAPELEKLVSLEKVIAILEGEENVF